jgi:hypothetical protein
MAKERGDVRLLRADRLASLAEGPGPLVNTITRPA